MTHPAKRKARMKANAVLEWKGRKLMCNGVCVAEVWHPSGGLWYPQAFSSSPRGKTTEAAARRAVSRRFKIEER